MTALALIWGASFLFIKVADEGLSPTQVALGRMLVGALVLVAIVLVRREPVRLERVVWLHLAAIAVVANVVPFYLFAWGEQRIASELAGIYNASTPLMTLIASLPLLPGERPTVWRTSGLIVGFGGVVIVMSPWALHGHSALAGQLACLGAAACYGVGFAYTRRFIAGRGSTFVLSAGQICLGSLELLLLTPFVGAQSVSLPPRVVLSVLALGALGTGLAYLFYYGLIRDVGATTAASVTYYVPFVAIALGIVVRGEPLRWTYLIGAVVLVLGVVLAERGLAYRRTVSGRAGARSDRAERAAAAADRRT